jgi:serine/threonine protein phosphatase PrpC
MNCFPCSRNTHSQSVSQNAYPCKWQHIATVALTVACAVIAILAFCRVGIFGQISYSPYIAYGFASLTAMILFGSFIHKAVLCCQNVPLESRRSASLSQENIPKPENETSPNKEDLTPPLPEKPLKERLPHRTGDAINWDDKVYSKKRSAAEKLAIQLDYAYRKGKENSKKFFKEEFKFDLTQNGEIFIDKNLGTDAAGAAETIGGRTDMEDDHVVVDLSLAGLKARFAAVFDGHWDSGEAAKFLKDEMPKRLENELKKAACLDDDTITNIFTKVFIELEEDIQGRPGGASASCMLQIDKAIYIANCGDSRTVLVRKDSAIQLTEDADHKNPRFEHSTQKLMRTKNPKTFHPRTSLIAAARDIGIHLIATRPKISRIEAGIEDDLETMRIGYQAEDYLLLASAGFWDVCTIHELETTLHAMIQANKTPGEMAGQLVAAAKATWDLAGRSANNISVIVVKI